MWQKPPPEAASQIPKCGCKLAHTIVALQAYCLNLVSCPDSNRDLKSNQQKKRKNVRRRRRKEFEKRTKKVVLTDLSFLCLTVDCCVVVGCRGILHTAFTSNAVPVAAAA